jgi:hypothetical protein
MIRIREVRSCNGTDSNMKTDTENSRSHSVVMTDLCDYSCSGSVNTVGSGEILLNNSACRTIERNRIAENVERSKPRNQLE